MCPSACSRESPAAAFPEASAGSAPCGRAPGSETSRQRTERPPARADRGTAQPRRGPCPRTGGQRESFHVSWRWGCSPNARQIRDTALCESPTSAAIDLVDQCVASGGVDSSVLTITSSTRASLTVRGRPGRGSSRSPSESLPDKPRPPLTHRLPMDRQPLRHLRVVQTLGRDQHDPRTLRHRLSARPPPLPRLELRPLLHTQNHLEPQSDSASDQVYKHWRRTFDSGH